MNKKFGRLLIIGITVYGNACVYRELPTGFDCSTSDLNVSFVSKLNASSCRSIDGNTLLSASGGTPPYDFSKGDGIYQTDPFFDRLAPGSYLFTVKDIKGCKSSVQVDIAAANSNLAATTTAVKDDQCFSHNGSITVTASGGTAPYVFNLDNGPFSGVSTFTDLKYGNHTVIVRDGDDCQRILIVKVERGNTGISYASQIRPIMDANCNFSGCHGTGTTGRDWTKFSDIKAKAQDIKNRTGSRSMPIGGFSLTQTQIDQIACWVDDGANEN